MIYSFSKTGQSIVGTACRMPNNPSSCYHKHSSSDGDCQVKVYHSKLDSDDYYENITVSLFIFLTKGK